MSEPSVQCSVCDWAGTNDEETPQGRCPKCNGRLDAIVEPVTVAEDIAARVATLRELVRLARQKRHDAEGLEAWDELVAIFRVPVYATGEQRENALEAALAVADALAATSHPTYGSLFDMAVELHRQLLADETPRIGLIAAFIELGLRQRDAAATLMALGGAQ